VARPAANGQNVNLQEMSKEMSTAEMTPAKEMMAACEASDYRNCAY